LLLLQISWKYLDFLKIYGKKGDFFSKEFGCETVKVGIQHVANMQTLGGLDNVMYFCIANLLAYMYFAPNPSKIFSTLHKIVSRKKTGAPVKTVSVQTTIKKSTMHDLTTAIFWY
jgi:hypothetical protein